MKTKNLLILIVVFILITSSCRNAFSFSKEIHSYITSYLNFLEPEILSKITKSNRGRDTLIFIWRKSDKWHFNDCDFLGTSKNIRKTYDKVIENFDPENKAPDFKGAAVKFGMLLHAVQDFYSHSNWVEMNYKSPQEVIPIFESGIKEWPILTPWGLYNGVVIVQGKTNSKDFKQNFKEIIWNSTEKNATIVTKNGESKKGLVTGKVYYLRFFYSPFCHKCPKESKALHWDPIHDVNEIHKDDKKSKNRLEYHEVAINTAITQTLHEWKRLVNLVYVSYGGKGLAILEKNWVRDQDTGRTLLGQISP
jgi:thiol-disulfide isomerase/thioredoxin